MRILIIVFTIFLLKNTAYSQKKTESDSSANRKYSLLNDRIANLEKKIESDRNINDRTFNSISVQLSVSSYLFTIMGIFFSIVAIGVGVYVTFVERKIVKIRESNQELLNKTLNAKKEVEELNDLIQKDVSGLYYKIKREETIDLLNRLKEIPKDILNIQQLLLTRELLPEDFEKLKVAFLKVSKPYREAYLFQFFQHFLFDSMNHEEIRKELLTIMPQVIEASFENDIIKSSKDFIRAIINNGIHNFKAENNGFFIALSSSKYQNENFIYSLFLDSLSSRKNQFDFLSTIDSTNEAKTAKINFAKLIIEKYPKIKMTESEILIINEINTTYGEEVV